MASRPAPPIVPTANIFELLNKGKPATPSKKPAAPTQPPAVSPSKKKAAPKTTKASKAASVVETAVRDRSSLVF
jgi:hypothetical protein